MPLTTCSGRQSKAPLRANQVFTSKDGNEARSCPGPKSANPHPLPRSKCSDPLTSSAEEDIFFSNFTRCSFISNKSNNASEKAEAQLPDDDMDNDTQQVEASLRDNSAVLHTESDMGTGISPVVTNERETTLTQSNSEHGSNVATNNTTEEHQKGKAVAEAEVDDNDNDSKGCDEEDKLEDGDKTTHKAGRLSKEAILAVHDFKAGLARKATRKESIWNQHQAWFKTVLHPSKATSLQAWKAKQAKHYHAHSHKDPKNAALWKQIQEHFDHAIATHNDLSSQESCSLMMAVCEMFAKLMSAVLALYWHHTYRIHVAGIVIYPGDEESGCQASSFFVGSDIVKALIDTQQVNAKHMIDEITTILKYKDLEAVQAGGKNINFLPPAALVANASLLCNSKSDRDRNRMVAPMVISKAFAEASHRLPILHALVGPYLRIHLGEMYEAELGQDEDEDDSDAEKGKMAKQKGKSKKVGVLLQDLTSYTGNMFEIPLVIDTDGVILHDLKDSEKFIKNLPPHITRKQIGKMIHAETPTSDASAEHSGSEASSGFSYMWYGSMCQLRGSALSLGALRSNLGAPHSNQGAMCSNQGALCSTSGAPCSNQFVPRHMDYDDFTDNSDLPGDYDNLPPSSPFSLAMPQGSNVAHGQSQYTHLREDICHSIASMSDNQK
ncbi:hypothetical protein EDD22DRAFT_954627 [Suillus occidentalis]|nr:hypothetical protein EDD22DRAFT_954627 [Suillus occidentalis]